MALCHYHKPEPLISVYKENRNVNPRSTYIKMLQKQTERFALSVFLWKIMKRIKKREKI